jgi:hypothetical protein
MKPTLSTVVWLLLLGCGGSPGPVGSEPLNPLFAGNWEGTSTFEIENYWGPLAAFALSFTPQGDMLSIRGICPDGEGGVDATGEADFAEWVGTFSCPAVQSADCDSYVVSYTKARVTLNPPSLLTLVATGSTLACGVAGPGGMTFTGSR